MPGSTATSDLPPLLGKSSAMESVRRILRRAAGVGAPVVLEGETGTGKSLAARWIHGRGARRSGPFVSLNCASIPEALFESELFGHRRGSFTGAVEHRIGLFETASGGTLFLDEVCELPVAQQVKLLTVLEEGAIRRVGDTKSRPVDVRILAATSRDLDDAVRSGRFRADLFHRLALLRCRLPPLRDRDGDLLLLASHFLEELGVKHVGTPAVLTPAGQRALRAHPWPGNVRELAHALEAALILSGRRTLDRSHLDAVVTRQVAAKDDSEAAAAGQAAAEYGQESGACGGPRPPKSRRYSFYGTEEEERALILRALERCQGNRTRTAERLGMSRSTLRTRLRKYGL